MENTTAIAYDRSHFKRILVYLGQCIELCKSGFVEGLVVVLFCMLFVETPYKEKTIRSAERFLMCLDKLVKKVGNAVDEICSSIFVQVLIGIQKVVTED